VLLVASLAVRLINIGAPVVGSNVDRQTQTAIGAWDLRENGISFLHPTLPLFGPPWEVPLEYPVYQLTAALLDFVVPWDNFDLTLRATSFLFFYGNALLLALLCRRIFRSELIELCVLGFFLFTPFNIYWSRGVMIDFSATFFALAYFLFFLRWLEQERWSDFALTVGAGSLAYLAKLTTVPIVVLPLAVCIVHRFWNALARSTDGLARAASREVPRALLVVLMTVIPLAVGYAYVRFGDSIKRASSYTEWLASDNLKAWTFGTLEQRKDWSKYHFVLSEIQNFILLRPMLVFFLLGCAMSFGCVKLTQSALANKALAAALLLSLFLPVILFFNLYIHSYYLISVVPWLALFMGPGLAWAFSKLPSVGTWTAVLLIVLASQSDVLWKRYSDTFRADESEFEVRHCRLMERHIPEQEPVVVVNQDWMPVIPYYLKRRAFMGRAGMIESAVDSGFLKEVPFRWLVEHTSGPTPIGAVELNWKHPYQYGLPGTAAPYRLVRLSDEPLPCERELDLLPLLRSVAGNAHALDGKGRMRVESEPEGFRIAWQLDQPVEQELYNALVFEMDAHGADRAVFDLAIGDWMDRYVQVFLLPNRVNRIVIPTTYLNSPTGFTSLGLEVFGKLADQALIRRFSFVHLET
jgi:hypothetical protein